MLQIYDTFSQQKREFIPLEKNKIKMYVCGITVYDYCHIGHARVFVGFDVISRYLRYRGYDVTYVRNITDIDDKIIKRAAENNENIDELTARFIAEMHKNEKQLNVLPPDQEPRATEHIAEIIKMIEDLIANDIAYVADNADVYYQVDKFVAYGQLAHKDLEQLQAGARVEVVEAKRSPLDFVLWKAAKPGEPSWDSPWGHGRPGWHIECSAMSTSCLGSTFDIHGGGSDLQFPHHENEIAQSEAATGQKFVNTWMHIGYVQINDEKMSKSLNNFFTINEVLAEYHPEIVRYFLLASHYRSAVNFSKEQLENAHAALQRMYLALRNLELSAIESSDSSCANEFKQRFQAAMDDDFNTPIALAVIFDLVKTINRFKAEDPYRALAYAKMLLELGGVFGLLKCSADEFLKDIAIEELTTIEKLVEQRAEARLNKDWATADTIRQQLDEMNIILEDTTSGTVWRKARKSKEM